jgi:hypothetical protein
MLDPPVSVAQQSLPVDLVAHAGPSRGTHQIEQPDADGEDRTAENEGEPPRELASRTDVPNTDVQDPKTPRDEKHADNRAQQHKHRPETTARIGVHDVVFLRRAAFPNVAG